MDTHKNLLDGPEPTRLPETPDTQAATRLLDEGTPAVEVAARYPAFSLAWAVLAEEAFAGGRTVESYAYARTGYHRGLDALRRAGWRGHGPVPYDHRPNTGFLRCLAALSRAASAIEETEEATRCSDFLRDSSTEAHAALLKE
jgi:hypothetical protein